MTNEIKEILKLIGNAYYYGNINEEQKEKYCNYITNLQKTQELNKIDKLINTDYGCISYYFKYNNRYLKSEIKEDINNILRGDE